MALNDPSEGGQRVLRPQVLVPSSSRGDTEGGVVLGGEDDLDLDPECEEE